MKIKNPIVCDEQCAELAAQFTDEQREEYYRRGQNICETRLFFGDKPEEVYKKLKELVRAVARG